MLAARLLPLTALFLAACAADAPGAPAPLPDSASASAPAQAVEESAAGAEAPESFALFFEQFRADTSFQRSRLAEPVRLVTMTENDAMEMVEQETDLERWTPQTLAWDGGERVAESFNGQADPAAVDPDADTVAFAITGLDNGVSVTYTFERRDGRWRLTRLADYSM